MNKQEWELLSEHTITQRSKILAEVALHGVVDIESNIIEGAAFRIAEVLEKYKVIDFAAEAFDNPPPPPPDWSGKLNGGSE